MFNNTTFNKNSKKTNKILLSLLIIVISTTAAAAQKQFKLRGDAIAGSKFRPIEATSPIPFDKSYDQLNEEQKQIFRASYGGLAETEQPPFPKEGTEVIYKPIIKAHKEIARAGNLFVVAMIDEKGKVENVAIYESPSDAMSQMATAVMFNTQFDPGTCSGKPCKMEFPFEFQLRPQEKQRQYN